MEPEVQQQQPSLNEPAVASLKPGDSLMDLLKPPVGPEDTTVESTSLMDLLKPKETSTPEQQESLYAERRSISRQSTPHYGTIGDRPASSTRVSPSLRRSSGQNLLELLSPSLTVGAMGGSSSSPSMAPGQSSGQSLMSLLHDEGPEPKGTQDDGRTLMQLLSAGTQPLSSTEEQSHGELLNINQTRQVRHSAIEQQQHQQQQPSTTVKPEPDSTKLLHFLKEFATGALS
jgi:hypothetical protein